MTKAIQLNLFGPPEFNQTEETRIDWSYSRRQTLERCTRQYYYEYYGAKVRLATTAAQKEEIRFLSTLSNCYLRSGELLHLAISFFFKKQDADNWLIDWARRVYRADYEFSRSKGSLESGQQKYPPQMLLEFYYDYAEAETAFAESEERLVKALETFLASPTYAEARYNGKRESSIVEEKIRINNTLFNARGKIDLAYLQNDGLDIVDWKTGQVEADSSLQLAFYAMWAVVVKGYNLENITLYYGQLSDGSLHRVRINQHQLHRVRARIIQDLERLHLLDPYGREANMRAFPACSLPRVCKLCAYRGICPEAAI